MNRNKSILPEPDTKSNFYLRSNCVSLNYGHMFVDTNMQINSNIISDSSGS